MGWSSSCARRCHRGRARRGRPPRAARSRTPAVARAPPKRSGRRRDDRDREPERRAAARRALSIADLAAVRLHDALGDEQAQARAALRAAGNTKELLEQAGLMLGRDPGPAVGDLEPDVRRRRRAVRPASARAASARARTTTSLSRGAKRIALVSRFENTSCMRSGSTNTSGRPGSTSARIVTCACSAAARCDVDRHVDERARGRRGGGAARCVPDSIRDRFSSSSTMTCRRSQSSRAANSRSRLLRRQRPDHLLGAQVHGHAQRRQRRAELVRDRGHQIVLELVEAEQPGDVLEHDRRARDRAVLAVDRRRRAAGTRARLRASTARAPPPRSPSGTYAPLPASTCAAQPIDQRAHAGIDARERIRAARSASTPSSDAAARVRALQLARARRAAPPDRRGRRWPPARPAAPAAARPASSRGSARGARPCR